MERVLKRVKEASDDESAYESQQQLKTVYHRLRSRRKLKEAYGLLSEGCKLQTSNEQMTCAGELGRLLLDAYCADGCPADSEHAELVLDILDHLLAKQEEFASEGKLQAASEGCKVAQAALKWAKQQDNKQLVMLLHNKAAKLHVASCAPDALAAASASFARGADSAAFATALAASAKQAPSSERTLFSARAALLILAAAQTDELRRRAEYAREVVDAFSAQVPCHERQQKPLIHFTDGLLQAVEIRSVRLLELLEREYRPSLMQDRELLGLLETVKQKHFGGPRGGLGGLLGSLFQNLGSDQGVATA